VASADSCVFSPIAVSALLPLIRTEVIVGVAGAGAGAGAGWDADVSAVGEVVDSPQPAMSTGSEDAHIAATK
jgi:hypothetical protein